MSEPLWNNEQIANAVRAAYANHQHGLPQTIMYGAMVEIRDDLQARIAELEANADHDALTAAYLRGVSDERERGRKRIAELEAKVAYYESPLPVGNGKRYEVTCDHRFTDEGVCVRCGEDAEEWDAGCVESIVNDVLDRDKRITELEAQLAAASGWQPVDDGDITSFLSIQDGGETIGVFVGEEYSDWYATEHLPTNVRLCRRTPAAGEKP